MDARDEVPGPDAQVRELEASIREWRHFVRDLERREASTSQEIEKASAGLADVTARLSRMKSEYRVILLEEYVIAVQLQKQLQQQVAEASRKQRSGLTSAEYYRSRITDAESKLQRLRSRTGIVIPFPSRRP